MSTDHQMPQSTPTDQTAPRRIIMAVLGTSLLAIATLFGLAVWMASVTDTTAAEKSTKIVSNALLSAQIRAESLLTDNATLYDLHDWIDRLAAEQFSTADRTALTTKAFHFFTAYFELSQTGDLHRAFWNSAATAPDASMSAAERSALLSLAGPPRADDGTLQTGYARIGGRPFLVTVAWTTSPNNRHADMPHHAAHLMVAARMIDDAFLRDKSARYVIENLLFARGGSQPEPHMARMTLRDANGGAVVTLGWQPPRPGRQSLLFVAPFITLVSIGLVAVNLWFGRSTARLAAATLKAFTLARTDQLTRLMNRNGLEEVAARDTVRTALMGGGAAVLYLDLNGFKQINDNLGHAAGDRALQVTAQRILSAVREQDFVARLGGDEFVCLILEDQPRVAAHHIAQRILDATDHPLRIENADHYVRPAIGIALAELGCELSHLIRMADAAMYHAKTSVSEEIVFYGEDVAPPEGSQSVGGNAA